MIQYENVDNRDWEAYVIHVGDWNASHTEVVKCTLTTAAISICLEQPYIIKCHVKLK
jgi:hypothetical protein